MADSKKVIEAVTLFLMSVEVKIQLAQKTVCEFDSSNPLSNYIKEGYELFVIPALEVARDLAHNVLSSEECKIIRQNHPFFALIMIAKALNDKAEKLKVFSAFTSNPMELQRIELAIGIYKDLVDELTNMAKKASPCEADLQQKLNELVQQASLNSTTYDSSAVSPEYSQERVQTTISNKSNKPKTNFSNTKAKEYEAKPQHKPSVHQEYDDYKLYSTLIVSIISTTIAFCIFIHIQFISNLPSAIYALLLSVFTIVFFFSTMFLWVSFVEYLKDKK